MTCNPDDLGVPPGGGALYQLGTITPAPGSAESPGTAVTIDYYGLVPAPNCQGAPASASGTTCTAGPYSADISIAAVGDATAADVACNTVWAQSVAQGAGLTPGSQLQVDYDPNCSTPIYEWAVCGARYHYLSLTTNAPPPGATATAAACSTANLAQWSSFGLADQSGSDQLGAVFPVGTAKPGTIPVYQFSYTAGVCKQGQVAVAEVPPALPTTTASTPTLNYHQGGHWALWPSTYRATRLLIRAVGWYRSPRRS